MVAGHVFTTDALLTQRKLARAILEQEGDYVFIAKDNQPQLREDSELLFVSLPATRPADDPAYTETVAAGHGRSERKYSAA